MKPHWEISQQEADACLAATEWCPAIHEYFRGGGYSSRFLTEGGVPFTMTRVNIIKGLGPVLQIAEGWSVELPKAMHDQLDARTQLYLAYHLVCAASYRQRPVYRCLFGDGELGR